MITNKDRAIVKAKFGGKCAMCGDLLKACHIWDINPIGWEVTENGELITTNENIENLYPACKSCEATRKKHGMQVKMSIEQFRADIAKSFMFLRSGGMTKNSYGKALRFGLITETHKPIVFYFEKVLVNN